MTNTNTKQTNSYILAARKAFINEIKESENLTLATLASLTAAIMNRYFYSLKNRESQNSILKVNSTDLNEKKTRAYLSESIFGVAELSQYQNQRPVYKKIKAAMFIFEQNKNKLNVAYTGDVAKDTDTAREYINQFGSLASILRACVESTSRGAGKRKEDKKDNSSAVSESESESQSESEKTTYQKVAEAFTQLNKLLTRVKKEDLNDAFLELVGANLKELESTVNSVNAKSKLSYKTVTKKAA